jgi:hypothetical protein
VVDDQNLEMSEETKISSEAAEYGARDHEPPPQMLSNYSRAFRPFLIEV